MAYAEPTIDAIRQEAELLRVSSGFKLTIEQALDRVCDSLGWVSYSHCLRCKATRGAASMTATPKAPKGS